MQIILAEDESAITLAVQDYGKGIEAAALPRLTEPFYQVEPGRHSGGSGLGLALCARIAQLHGTALEFESHPRAGTTVRLALQAAKGGEGDEDEAQNPT